MVSSKNLMTERVQKIEALSKEILTQCSKDDYETVVVVVGTMLAAQSCLKSLINDVSSDSRLENTTILGVLRRMEKDVEGVVRNYAEMVVACDVTDEEDSDGE